ncbi:hypothetical protein ZHAS_00011652 [Anopheles sinensis]|uniref:Uncharacterized protein n=1 Tax=Anopheles sinensis TaxID=74873 RepID=A0A084W0R6_ANOSI|nr:hypothetical protein ZHAS_00011652 [Anopheles sinensis]
MVCCISEGARLGKWRPATSAQPGTRMFLELGQDKLKSVGAHWMCGRVCVCVWREATCHATCPRDNHAADGPSSSSSASSVSSVYRGMVVKNFFMGTCHGRMQRRGCTGFPSREKAHVTIAIVTVGFGEIGGMEGKTALLEFASSSQRILPRAHDVRPCPRVLFQSPRHIPESAAGVLAKTKTPTPTGPSSAGRTRIHFPSKYNARERLLGVPSIVRPRVIFAESVRTCRTQPAKEGKQVVQPRIQTYSDTRNDEPYGLEI